MNVPSGLRSQVRCAFSRCIERAIAGTPGSRLTSEPTEQPEITDVLINVPPTSTRPCRGNALGFQTWPSPASRGRARSRTLLVRMRASTLRCPDSSATASIPEPHAVSWAAFCNSRVQARCSSPAASIRVREAIGSAIRSSIRVACAYSCFSPSRTESVPISTLARAEERSSPRHSGHSCCGSVPR